MKRSSLTWGALISAALFAAACAGNHPKASKTDATGAAGDRPAAAPTEAARIVNGEPDVRDMNLRVVPELKTVSFSYDSDRLDESGRATLQANAQYLKEHADMKVQVSGHCDQRGTVAYNLALGQRRASSVRDYYKALGVDPARVATISWGREHLLCSVAEESCWSRNRRAETLQALSAAVAGTPH
jgi:peptidoglycan-associated lipoprotein